MKKGIGRKIGIVSLTLVMILANITFMNNVIATVEEGTFTAEECPYNIAFTKVDTNGSITLAIDESGNLWTWGQSNYGLGDGTTIKSYTPMKIKEGTYFKEISVGNSYCVAIDEDGNIWTWGYNSAGRLGNGTTDNSNIPIQITEETKFTKISAGPGHCLAVDEDGNLWAWGGIGLDSINTSYIPIQIIEGTSFKEIAAPKEAAYVHSLAIDADGNLWAWGNNKYGQLGDGTTDNSTVPILIKEGTKFKKIGSGNIHSVAIDESGNLWTWGTDTVGSLGNGSTSNSYTPTQIKQGTKFSDIKVSGYSNLAIDEEGNLWAWGDNAYGQLGDGTETDSNVPIQIEEGTKFKEISISSTINLTIDENDILWATGYNGYGTFGNGTTEKSLEYIQITQKISSYTVTFMNGAETVKTEIVEEGNSATAPSLTKAGYTLSWDTDFSNVTSDLTVKAIWTANTNTAYKVEHYKQNIILNGYELVETENKTGTTDSLAVALSKTYEGFTENTEYSERVASGNVAGDRSLVLKLYYDRNSYNVTLNTNEGIINSGDITSYVYGVGATLPTDITRTGYTFNGWYDNSEFTGEAVTSIGVDATDNKEYFAKWTINQYTVTFKDGESIEKTETVNYGSSATAPELTKAGYTLSWDTDFSNITTDLTVTAVWTANTDTAYKVEHYKQNTTLDGYEIVTEDTENLTGTTDTQATATAKTYEGFTENTEHSDREASGNIAGDGSLVLKLYYDRNSYNVTLNTNEGTINSGDVTSYVYGIGATLPTDITRTGYTFNGWYDNSEFTGEAVTSIGVDATDNKEYFAKWTINQYAVTFKDGENTVDTQTINYGSSATAPELAKAGYTLSWDTEFNNITEDLTVNAVWTANTDTVYTVEHYKQNLTLDGYEIVAEDTENLTGTTDTEVTATAKTYEGFTENTEHSDRVATGTIAGDGSLVLKLYYDRNSYNVTLNTNEGTINSGDVTSYVYGVGATLPTDITRTGYTFNGWYDNSEFTGNAVTSISTTDIEDKTYYAKWTINTYTVTFKDGEDVVDTQTIDYGSSATAPELTKAGYTLSWDADFSNITEDVTINAVWTANTDTAYIVEHYKQNLTLDGYEIVAEDTENLTGTTYTEVTATAKTYEGFTENTEHSDRVATGTIAGDGSLVLKLYYDRNIYNVTLEANGGTINSGDITSYVYGIGATLPTDITKLGYTFAHWWNSEDNIVNTISATDIGDKEYTAVWLAEEYMVIFKDGDKECSRFAYGYGQSATAPELTKAGYTLSWDKDFSYITENLTVNAIWTPNTDTAYKVEHYKQNLTLDGYEIVTEHTENLTGTTDTEVTATAKTYEGFTENTEYSERVASGNIAGDGSLVLKLYYDRNSYNVTLNTNEGIINSGDITSYVYGVGATLPTDITRTGYTFNGWYDNSEFTGDAVTSIAVTDIEDKTYYAKWTINQYTVTFKDGESIEKTETVNYGSSATAPELTKAGYTLRWDKDFSYITENLTVNAIWTPNTDTAYKVEHYKQNLTLDGYEIVTEDTENLTGITDTQVTATAKTYEGFTENTEYSERVASGNIAGDGSLVLKLYYDRKTYDVNINILGQEGTTTYVYGQVVTLPTDLEKEGYTFGGWYDNEEFTGDAITEITINEETASKTYYIKWIPNEYTVTLNTDGGTINSGNVTSYVYGVGATLPTDITRTDYIFVGWYDNSELTGETVTSISTTDIGDKVYYAKWVAEEKFYITSEQYSINLEESYITKVIPETDVKTFVGGITTNATLRVLNSDREEVTEDAIVATGYIIELEFKGTKYEYEIAVRGDLDGNGKVTITDLSILNQALVKDIVLTGIKEKAADIDSNKMITVTDLSMMNQHIVGKIEL